MTRRTPAGASLADTTIGARSIRMAPGGSGSSTDLVGGAWPWDARPLGDPFRAPSMRDRVSIVLAHARRADTLVDEPDLSRGAALVAAVGAVRLAVTPPASVAERADRGTLLRELSAWIDPVRRVRFERLVEVGLEREVDRRRLAGLGVEADDRRPGVGPISRAAVPAGTMADARRRYLAASRFDADLDVAMDAVGRALRDMAALARRGSPTEDLRRSLADAAFALCLGAAASADDADVRIGLLGILHDAQREGAPSRDVIRAGMAMERRLWGGAVAGRA